MRTFLKYFIVLMLVSCSGALQAHGFLVTTPPTACQAVFLNNALSAELKWNDNGIQNYRSNKDAWVVCPIQLAGELEVDPVVDVWINVGNPSDSPVEFFCYLKEIGDDFGAIQSRSLVEVVQPRRTGRLTLALKSTDQRPFSSVSLTCRIPSGGILGGINVWRI